MANKNSFSDNSDLYRCNKNCLGRIKKKAKLSLREKRKLKKEKQKKAN